MRTQCISDLQRFETFRNCCFFCKFCILRNLYSGNAHHPNYGKHSLNDHFLHCANSLYHFLSFLQISKFQLVLHIFPFTKFQLRFCALCQQWWTSFKSSFPILHTLCRWDLPVFSHFSNLLFVFHIWDNSQILLRWCATSWLWQT